MTKDERTEAAILFFQEQALRQHRIDTDGHAVSRPECEECGNGIPAERQRAIPGVRLCVECKQAEEKRDRLYL